LYIFVALLATISNYYNYAIFGLSASFLSSEFFPEIDGTSKLTNFFIVLFFAVLVKPVASIIFGNIGDIYGRAKSLRFTAYFSIIGMIILSFLPGFKEIGSLAVGALLVSRVLILASVTGESDGMRVYITENLNKNKINFANSLVTSTGQIGVLIASFMILFLRKYDFSLRIAFIVGAALNFIVILLRNHLTESKEFVSNKIKVPVGSFIKQNYAILLVCILINGCIGGIYHFYIIYMSSYLPNISNYDQYFITTLSIVAYILCAPLSGYLADRFGFILQAFIALTLSCLLCLTSVIILWDMSKMPYIFIIAQVVLLPFYAVPMQIYLKDKIPVNLRYRTFSLCHSIGSVIISSPTPFIANLIWFKSGTNWLNFTYALSLFVMLISCLCYLTTIEKRKTKIIVK